MRNYSPAMARLWLLRNSSFLAMWRKTVFISCLILLSAGGCRARGLAIKVPERLFIAPKGPVEARSEDCCSVFVPRCREEGYQLEYRFWMNNAIVSRGNLSSSGNYDDLAVSPLLVFGPNPSESEIDSSKILYRFEVVCATRQIDGAPTIMHVTDETVVWGEVYLLPGELIGADTPVTVSKPPAVNITVIRP